MTILIHNKSGLTTTFNNVQAYEDNGRTFIFSYIYNKRTIIHVSELERIYGYEIR